MTERFVTVGVHPQVLREVYGYRNAGDALNEQIIEDTVDDLIDELHFRGALDKRTDKIHVAFQEDDGVDPNSLFRVVKVAEEITDEQDENVIGKREEIYMFEFEPQNNN